ANIHALFTQPIGHRPWPRQRVELHKHVAHDVLPSKRAASITTRTATGQRRQAGHGRKMTTAGRMAKEQNCRFHGGDATSRARTGGGGTTRNATSPGAVRGLSWF